MSASSAKQTWSDVGLAQKAVILPHSTGHLNVRDSYVSTTPTSRLRMLMVSFTLMMERICGALDAQHPSKGGMSK
jgi:hypothetical protein